MNNDGNNNNDNSDENSDDDDNVNVKKGYCHFNENGNDKTFTINLYGHELVIEQDPDSTIGHGSTVWDSSVIFSKYVEYNPTLYSSSTLSGKTVIELGSGTGLAGLSLLLLGCKVTFTDLPDVVTQFTSINTNRIYNQLKSKGSGYLRSEIHPPIVKPLDWTWDNDLLNNTITESPYDIVLLTDCVFSKRLVPFLVQTIIKCSGPKTQVICSHEIRDEDANNAFKLELKEHYNIKRIPFNKLNPSYQNEFVEVLIAKSARGKKH
jgi:predicted nicotinamide N-methyase